MSDRETFINFGPQHPGAHGVLNLIIRLSGETVREIEPQIGFLHRGTEKLLEHKTYAQGLPYMDRLDYVSPLAQEHCFSIAIEKMLQISVPERAQYIRVLLLELQRIGNHLLSITSLALDTGATTPLLWAFEAREELMGIYEEISGSRMHCAYIRTGGVNSDLNSQIIDKISLFLLKLPKVLSDIESLLNDNRIFKQRLVNIGIISKSDALDFALTGAMLRASGIPWDLRKSQPYEVYSKLEFSIPVGVNGDCYDRYNVRVLEIKESIKIATQCIEKMPKGEYLVNDRKVTPPPKAELATSMEAVIHHFKLFSEGYTVPAGETYTAVETPKGEFGLYIVSDGSNKPYRIHIRAPGFAHLQILNKMSIGHMLSDVSSNLGTIDAVFGEIDR
ncbi:NADH-quinone oxidoreductase subunit D [Candidatus Fokinia crypta]|uniref:NADH-quinone oxidoreductase subunit D n=1 Tax=Candidatus Fokinia crypta TaxID=1920990 RepID=A0ABZ0UPT3_9RICK|nr:NADH-quinone oxidoreductase subunit D [Candidatus Fokinia cryptica]WPX98139.1 NADH-quinone oxidoreductase subunit D [Candidatus Fokinia cryptica]